MLTTLHTGITMGAFPLVQDLWWVARNHGVMETQCTFKFGSSSAPDIRGERFCNFFTPLILKTPHITAELKHSKISISFIGQTLPSTRAVDQSLGIMILRKSRSPHQSTRVPNPVDHWWGRFIKLTEQSYHYHSRLA